MMTLFFGARGNKVSILIYQENYRVNAHRSGALRPDMGAKHGTPLLSAEFKPGGKEKYLRVECIRPDGKGAWSNPLWLDAK